MAKKKISPGARPGELDKGELYPWLRLLELEVQPSEHPGPRRGRGRPPSPFPRKAVHVTLTEDELEALDDLARLLSASFDSRVHRGHVISFLVFYLSSRLQNGSGGGLQMPAGIKTLTDLAHYLDLSKL